MHIHCAVTRQALLCLGRHDTARRRHEKMQCRKRAVACPFVQISQESAAEFRKMRCRKKKVQIPREKCVAEKCVAKSTKKYSISYNSTLLWHFCAGAVINGPALAFLCRGPDQWAPAELQYHTPMISLNLSFALSLSL